MASPQTVNNKDDQASFYPLRLCPGDEIVASLQKFVKLKELKASFIATCCGSVTRAKLRFAYKPGREAVQELKQHFEILSLMGTVCEDGSHHLHISLGDAAGNVIGGHVMGDLYVFTTAEIVLGNCVNYIFKREMDSKTGYPELEVKNTL